MRGSRWQYINRLNENVERCDASLFYLMCQLTCLNIICIMCNLIKHIYTMLSNSILTSSTPRSSSPTQVIHFSNLILRRIFPSLYYNILPKDNAKIFRMRTRLGWFLIKNENEVKSNMISFSCEMYSICSFSAIPIKFFICFLEYFNIHVVIR